MHFEHPIEWTDEKVSRLWDFYQKTPPYSESYFSKVFGKIILKKSGLPQKENISILDFGCGPGFLWEHIRSSVAAWSYTGLDFSLESVENVNHKGHGDPRFKGAFHVTSLPSTLPSGNFDVVTLVEVVEHLKDDYLQSTLSEVSRVLKKGGVLLITTPNQEDLSKSTKFCPDCGAIFHEWQHVRSWSPSTLCNKLEQFGFRARRIKTLDFAEYGFVGRMRQIMRLLLKGQTRKPHMLAIFQKM